MSTILLLDDNRVSSLMISTMVKSNFPTSSFHQPVNPKAAAEVCDTTDVDVLIIDLHMPGQNPLDTAVTFTNQFNVKNVVIVAKESDELESCCKKLGHSFISRPITEKSLLATLRSLISVEPTYKTA